LFGIARILPCDHVASVYREMAIERCLRAGL
jgi:hypothetical protein